MKITIGCDHAGIEYKSKIITFLETKGDHVLDVGTFDTKSVDYPDYAHLVSEEVVEGADFGILICGSGNGVSMAANKHKGIRAALCWNNEIAKLARQHNDANIISIPARFISIENTLIMLSVFLHEKFEGGRHTNRVNKI